MSEIPTLQEAEERGPQVQGLPGVHGKFKDRQGYPARPCFTEKKI